MNKVFENNCKIINMISLLVLNSKKELNILKKIKELIIKSIVIISFVSIFIEPLTMHVNEMLSPTLSLSGWWVWQQHWKLDAHSANWTCTTPLTIDENFFNWFYKKRKCHITMPQGCIKSCFLMIFFFFWRHSSPH